MGKLRYIIQLLSGSINLPFMSNTLLSKYKARPYHNSYLNLASYQRPMGLSAGKQTQVAWGQRPPSNGNTSLLKYNKNPLPRNDYNPQPVTRQYNQPQTKNGLTGYQRERQLKKERQRGQLIGGYRESNEPRSGKNQDENGGLPKSFGDHSPHKNGQNQFNNNKVKIQASRIQQDSSNVRLPSASSMKSVNLVGLNNIGNTCYMNSILQCMLNLPGFNDYFLENKHSHEMTINSRVAQAYHKLLQLMRGTSRRAENPVQIKAAVAAKRPRFSGYSQQDAQQFLTALLEQLSLDLNRSKNPKYKELTADLSKQSLQQISQDWWNYNRERESSVVCDYFTGQLLSRVVCSSCRTQSIAFDNTWDFALNFTNNDQGDLYRMLENFLREETISKDYYCSKCKDFRECRRKLDFYRLPTILVLQLKRFSYGKYSKQKINTRVKVPTELNLSKLISNSSHISTNNSSYKLVGVVHHSGDIDFGHYTAECRNPMNGRWYSFNDSLVNESDMREGLDSSTPYLLFFAKNS